MSLSTYDPVDVHEGALDPLGLNPIADRLGNKLTPGIRERMQHPRFLTAVAVGAELCRPFLDEVASDGITPPHIVYEWYVIQAFYKTFRDSDELIGFPGILKAKNAWIKKDPFSHTRYLKTAPIFGFNGVYKTLAEELDIVQDGLLDENGDQLLRVWSEEQSFPGFLGQENAVGAGRQFKQTFRNAIEESLKKGEVFHPWSWHWFKEIAERLGPYRAGNREKRFIRSLLLNNETGYRRQLLESLQEFLQRNENVVWTERQFHEYLIKSFDPPLKELLLTIQSYEKFARIITTSFYNMLYYLSDKNRKIQGKELEEQRFSKIDVTQLRDLYESVYGMLSSYNESNNFHKNFAPFGLVNGSRDFIITLINHHHRVQKNKPPFGKAPWLESFGDGTYMIRPLYRQDEPIKYGFEYVNRYRVSSLISFREDLK